MTQIPRYLTLALSLLVFSCSETEPEPPLVISDEEKPILEIEYVLPEIDPLEYAATELPTEIFRFEYQFQSDQLGFTIKANQLNERVICDITFEDGSKFPIELYVNQYRTLANDLIQAVSSSKSESENQMDHFESILVQSVAKTYRLKKPDISLSKELVEWISKHLQTDANRAHFQAEIAKPQF